MKKILVIIITAFITTSCIKDVDVTLPESSPQLVLNALIYPEDETISATLSLTLPYSDISNNPPYIGNGKILLFKNGNFIAEMPVCDVQPYYGNDSIYYYCINERIAAGDKITVTASFGKYSDVSGSCTIPARVTPQDIQTDSGSQSLSFTLSDDPLAQNFYTIELMQIDTLSGMAYFSPIQSRDRSIELLGYSGEVISLPTDDPAGLKAFITDKSFNGRTRKFEFTSSGFSGVSYHILRVTSCSADYYEYARTVLMNQTSNPFNEPVQVHSNVTGGLGLIGSLSPVDTILNF